MSESFSRTYFSNVNSSLSEENSSYVAKAQSEASETDVIDIYDDDSEANVVDNDIILKFYHNGPEPLFGLVRPNGDFYIHNGTDYVPFDPKTDAAKFFSFETAFKSLQDHVNSSLQEGKNNKGGALKEANANFRLALLKIDLDKKSKVFLDKKNEFLKVEEFNKEYNKNYNDSVALTSEASNHFLVNAKMHVLDPGRLRGDKLKSAEGNFNELYKVKDINSDLPFSFKHNGRIFYGHVQSNGDSADFYVSNNPNDKGRLLDPRKDLELFNSFQNGFRELLAFEKNNLDINDKISSCSYIVRHCDPETSDIKKRINSFKKLIINNQKLLSNTKDESAKIAFKRQILSLDKKKKDAESTLLSIAKKKADHQAKLNFLEKCKEEYKQKKSYIFAPIEIKFQNKLIELSTVLPHKYQPYNSLDLNQSQPTQLVSPVQPVVSAQPTVQPTTQPTIQPNSSTQPQAKPVDSVKPTIQSDSSVQPQAKPVNSVKPSLKPTESAPKKQSITVKEYQEAIIKEINNKENEISKSERRIVAINFELEKYKKGSELFDKLSSKLLRENANILSLQKDYNSYIKLRGEVSNYMYREGGKRGNEPLTDKLRLFFEEKAGITLKQPVAQLKHVQSVSPSKSPTSSVDSSVQPQAKPDSAQPTEPTPQKQPITVGRYLKKLEKDFYDYVGKLSSINDRIDKLRYKCNVLHRMSVAEFNKRVGSLSDESRILNEKSNDIFSLQTAVKKFIERNGKDVPLTDGLRLFFEKEAGISKNRPTQKPVQPVLKPVLPVADQVQPSVPSSQPVADQVQPQVTSAESTPQEKPITVRKYYNDISRLARNTQNRITLLDLKIVAHNSNLKKCKEGSEDYKRYQVAIRRAEVDKAYFVGRSITFNRLQEEVSKFVNREGGKRGNEPLTSELRSFFEKKANNITQNQSNQVELAQSVSGVKPGDNSVHPVNHSSLESSVSSVDSSLQSLDPSNQSTYTPTKLSQSVSDEQFISDEIDRIYESIEDEIDKVLQSVESPSISPNQPVIPSVDSLLQSSVSPIPPLVNQVQPSIPHVESTSQEQPMTIKEYYDIVTKEIDNKQQELNNIDKELVRCRSKLKKCKEGTLIYVLFSKDISKKEAERLSLYKDYTSFCKLKEDVYEFMGHEGNEHKLLTDDLRLSFEEKAGITPKQPVTQNVPVQSSVSPVESGQPAHILPVEPTPQKQPITLEEYRKRLVKEWKSNNAERSEVIAVLDVLKSKDISLRNHLFYKESQKESEKLRALDKKRNDLNKTIRFMNGLFLKKGKYRKELLNNEWLSLIEENTGVSQKQFQPILSTDSSVQLPVPPVVNPAPPPSPPSPPSLSVVNPAQSPIASTESTPQKQPITVKEYYATIVKKFNDITYNVSVRQKRINTLNSELEKCHEGTASFNEISATLSKEEADISLLHKDFLVLNKLKIHVSEFMNNEGGKKGNEPLTDDLRLSFEEKAGIKSKQTVTQVESVQPSVSPDQTTSSTNSSVQLPVPPVESDQLSSTPTKPAQQSTPSSNLSQSQIDELYAKSVIDELKEVNELYRDYEKKVVQHYEEQSQQSKPSKSTLYQKTEQELQRFQTAVGRVNEIAQLIAPPMSEAEKQEFGQKLEDLVDDESILDDESIQEFHDEGIEELEIEMENEPLDNSVLISSPEESIDNALRGLSGIRSNMEKTGQNEAKIQKQESLQKFQGMSRQDLQREVNTLKKRKEKCEKDLKELEKRIKKQYDNKSKVKQDKLLVAIGEISGIKVGLGKVSTENGKTEKEIKWANRILNQKKLEEIEKNKKEGGIWGRIKNIGIKIER
jgi:hypothetical protein